MKVLVTGGRGMLGADVASQFAQLGHKVVAVDIQDFDIADLAETSSVMRSVSPELVIHCAAYTNVDGAEGNPDLAFRVNAIGAGSVAVACREIGARIITISTDFVFDGEKGTPYTESDLPAPLSVYGMSKLAGEKAVRDECPNHLVVRTAWLYGAHGKSFPRTMIDAARAGKTLRVVADQTGSPTYTRDLAASLAKLADIPLTGTLHLTNSGHCTWRDLAVEAIGLAGLTGVEVAAIRTAEWPAAAARPHYSVLDTGAWEHLGQPPLRSWKEALAEFVEEIRGA